MCKQAWRINMINCLDQLVINHLNKFNCAYTKSLYKALRVKDDYNISMNKFRDMLYNLNKQSRIEITEINGLPCWRKRDEH